MLTINKLLLPEEFRKRGSSQVGYLEPSLNRTPSTSYLRDEVLGTNILDNLGSSAGHIDYLRVKMNEGLSE